MSYLFPLYWTITQASAQVFNGPGIVGGVGVAQQIDGPLNMTLRDIVLNFLYKALGFLALAGVIMIVVAGFMMVLSGGDDTTKDKAKKIILYVVIGIIIIFLARAVVGFLLTGLPY